MSDFDDLLADAPPPKNRGGRPRKEDLLRRAEERMAEAAVQLEIREAGAGRTRVPLQDFQMPCSQKFLADVWGMEPATVRKRLMGKGLEVGSIGQGRQVYNFQEASKYLIKPKMDLATYLKTLNPAEMPNSINKVFWEAERIKNKTLIETGEAWPTDKVLDTLGAVFMLIKDRIPLITEEMRDRGLTDDQLAKLSELTDQFQRDLHESLIELPQKRQTYSRVHDIDPGDLPSDDEDDF